MYAAHTTVYVYNTSISSTPFVTCQHAVVVRVPLRGRVYMSVCTACTVYGAQDVPWSTERVLEVSLERAAAAGVQVAPRDSLPCLRDIDTEQDLREWMSSEAAEAHDGAGSNTATATASATGACAGAGAGAGGTAGQGRGRRHLLQVVRQVLLDGQENKL